MEAVDKKSTHSRIESHVSKSEPGQKQRTEQSQLQADSNPVI